LEAISFSDLSGMEIRAVVFIIRKTWGWKKHWDKIALSEFEKNLHSDRKNVKRTLEGLNKKNVIFIDKKETPFKYKYNKYIEKWQGVRTPPQQGVKWSEIGGQHTPPTGGETTPLKIKDKENKIKLNKENFNFYKNKLVRDKSI